MSLDRNVWGRLFGEPQPRGQGHQAGVPGVRLCQIVEVADEVCLAGLGVGREYRWQPGLNRAACRKGHRPAAPTCSCGLYGCTDLAALVRTLGLGFNDVALCAVLAKGRVVIHERGWRAEFAEIAAISSETPARVVRDRQDQVIRIIRRPLPDQEQLTALGAAYGVPVVPLASIIDFGKEVS